MRSFKIDTRKALSRQRKRPQKVSFLRRSPGRRVSESKKKADALFKLKRGRTNSVILERAVFVTVKGNYGHGKINLSGISHIAKQYRIPPYFTIDLDLSTIRARQKGQGARA